MSPSESARFQSLVEHPHLLFRRFDHDEAPTLRLASGFGFHSLLSCSPM